MVVLGSKVLAKAVTVLTKLSGKKYLYTSEKLF